MAIASAVTEKLAEIRALCERLKIAKLWVFGSASRGDWDPSRSDIDFLAEFSNQAPVADQLLGLYAGLGEIFPCRVDLISIRGVKNPRFRAVLERTRLPIYAAA